MTAEQSELTPLQCYGGPMDGARVSAGAPKDGVLKCGIAGRMCTLTYGMAIAKFWVFDWVQPAQATYFATYVIGFTGKLEYMTTEAGNTKGRVND